MTGKLKLIHSLIDCDLIVECYTNQLKDIYKYNKYDLAKLSYK